MGPEIFFGSYARAKPGFIRNSKIAYRKGGEGTIGEVPPAGGVCSRCPNRGSGLRRAADPPRSARANLGCLRFW